MNRTVGMVVLRPANATERARRGRSRKILWVGTVGKNTNDGKDFFWFFWPGSRCTDDAEWRPSIVPVPATIGPRYHGTSCCPRQRTVSYPPAQKRRSTGAKQTVIASLSYRSLIPMKRYRAKETPTIAEECGPGFRFRKKGIRIWNRIILDGADSVLSGNS